MRLNKKRTLFIFTTLLSLSGFLVVKNSATADQAEKMLYRFYREDTSVFSNPGKGWFEIRYTDNLGNLSGLRDHHVSTVLLEAYLGDYKDGPISGAKLSEIRRAFNALRVNNLSAIFRAGYSFMAPGQPTDNFEPADIDTILNHIQQLAPIFEENADILSSVQAGFFGPWGEWHNSIYSTVTDGAFIAPQNADTVIGALMDAVPYGIPIQVRTPMYARMLTGASGDPSWLPRLGIYDDGMFANVSDYGTYMKSDYNGLNNGGVYAADYGDRENELDWISRQCANTPFTGESADVGAGSPYSAADNAICELDKLHAQLLNIQYPPAVISKWKAASYDGGNAFDYITRRLGYNFVLLQAGFNTDISPGRYLHIEFDLENNGFGNLLQAKDFDVVLENDQETYTARVNDDPRGWAKESGIISRDLYFSIPLDIEPGVWHVCFELSDPSPSLKNNPAFSIRLADEGVWNAAAGDNYIGDIAVSGDSPGTFTQFRQISKLEIKSELTPAAIPNTTTITESVTTSAPVTTSESTMPASTAFTTTTLASATTASTTTTSASTTSVSTTSVSMTTTTSESTTSESTSSSTTTTESEATTSIADTTTTVLESDTGAEPIITPTPEPELKQIQNLSRHK